MSVFVDALNVSRNSGAQFAHGWKDMLIFYLNVYTHNKSQFLIEPMYPYNALIRLHFVIFTIPLQSLGQTEVTNFQCSIPIQQKVT